MFDVFFSVSHGFSVDFPFVQFSISTPALVVLAIAFVAFKVAKVVKARKANAAYVPEMPAWDSVEGDPFNWAN